jgi:CDP-glucose 4,6-dehydratase
MLLAVDREFWQSRPVFVTGHTGFKGGWLGTWLVELGARVVGYGLPPHTEPSYFVRTGLGDHLESSIGDVRDAEAVAAALSAARPSVVFHLAAQPIVRLSYRAPGETIATNVLGTTHVLEAVRRTPGVDAVVVVTSDKCYENHERPEGYREDDPLGGHDPYSASKASAELITAAYRRSFFASEGPAVATVRAGNVIGGGDWALDRLVPDAMRAVVRGESVRIRNPAAVRPWQHVLEPISGYLRLAQRLCDDRVHAGAWNFGPRDEDAVPVATLIQLITERWRGARWEAAPESDPPHEAGLLRLDCEKARTRLGWQPVLRLPDTVELTVDWYRAAAEGASAATLWDLSVAQIREHERRQRIPASA